MKALVTSLVALLVTGGLILPGLIGVQAQQRYQEALAQIERQGLTLERRDYRRGWFRAEVRDEWMYWPSGPGAPMRIGLYSRIHHGPWTPDGWLLALMETRVTVDDGALSEPLRMRVDFRGRGSGRLAAAALSLERPNRPQLTGLEAGIEFDVSDPMSSGRLRLAGLAQGDEGNGLEGLELEWRLRAGSSGIPLGDLALRVAHLRLPAAAAEQPLELAGLALRAALVPQGDLLRLELGADLRELRLAHASYGPGEARLFIANLAPRALRGLQPLLVSAPGPATSPEQAERLRDAVLARRAPELVAADPLIDLGRLHLSTPFGEVEASLRLQAMGMGWPPPAGAKLLKRLQGGAELRLPEALARALVEARSRQRLLSSQRKPSAGGEGRPVLDTATFERQLAGVVDFQLKALVNQGLLAREGGGLVARVTLEQGIARVNGKDLPLALALR